ncbi:MAG: outer membrane lipoprotein carrier protein LolA [Bacteroidetes bacterium]|nr:outer membrane lipoprotein carrier protein LolA [Bacteroidota bacterium]
MKTAKILVFIMALQGVCMFLQAQTKPLSPTDAMDVRKKISEAAKLTLCLEAQFTQTKELSVIKEKIISKGNFYFKKEKLLRWEYTDPFPYLIIFNNDKVFVKDEDKENHINLQSNKVFREVNNILIGAVQGSLLSDTKNFDCSIFDLRDEYQATMIPVNLRIKETLSEIILYFNKSDYTVDKLIMREVSGDYTRIEFSGKKINQNVPDAKFNIP